MKEALIFLLGAVVAYVVLSMLTKKSETSNTDSTAYLKKLAVLPETVDLLKSKEFKNLSMTPEFKQYVKTLTQEQIYVLAKSLTS